MLFLCIVTVLVNNNFLDLKMILALIGMSGIGKTFWSKKLESIGFTRFCCDDLIEQELREERIVIPEQGTQALSNWLGQPYEKDYDKKSLKYLSLETKVLEKIFLTLKKNYKLKNIIIDTTGSIVHLDEKIIIKLKKIARIVYLDTPNYAFRTMYKQHKENPKPIIWGPYYGMNNRKNPSFFFNSYARLLQYRHKKYMEYADLLLGYKFHHNNQITPNDFIHKIQILHAKNSLKN